MTRVQCVSAKVVTFAFLLGAAQFTSTSAYALPHFGVHRHPADGADNRVHLVIYNRCDIFRDVVIDGHVYTVMPHNTLSVKAPEGTPVYTNTTGSMHHKGDLLFAVARTMQNRTVVIN